VTVFYRQSRLLFDRNEMLTVKRPIEVINDSDLATEGIAAHFV
jgi:hypothetical protein